MTSATNLTSPLLLTLAKCFEALDIRPTKGKSLLDTNGGPIETVEIGRRRLVVYPSLIEYVEKLRAAPRQDARRNGPALDAAAERRRARKGAAA